MTRNFNCNFWIHICRLCPECNCYVVIFNWLSCWTCIPLSMISYHHNQPSPPPLNNQLFFISFTFIFHHQCVIGQPPVFLTLSSLLCCNNSNWLVCRFRLFYFFVWPFLLCFQKNLFSFLTFNVRQVHRHTQAKSVMWLLFGRHCVCVCVWRLASFKWRTKSFLLIFCHLSPCACGYMYTVHVCVLFSCTSFSFIENF